MRQRLERYLLSVWYGDRSPPLWLRPLSVLFAVLSGVRRQLFARGWLAVYRPRCRVLVVGNITVGGSGKTPLVEWVCRRAQELGISVGIASRGYGSSARALRMVSATSSAENVGDEPLLLARRLNGIPVAVAARRRDAVAALDASGVDLVVMDDGMQHYAVARDFELAVVDGQRGLGNGRLMPAGPLREAPARLAQCDLVVTLGDSESYWLEIDRPRGVGSEDRCDLRDLKRVVALAGIGHPERFFRVLEEAGLDFERRVFPDHHRFEPADVQDLLNRCVITTEKDAVKLECHGGRNWWYLPVRARLGTKPTQVVTDWLTRLSG